MRLDEILSTCIEAIERGETVEDCLARYPVQAAELHPLLTLVTYLYRSHPPRLSDAAFQQGRHLLGAAAARAQFPSLQEHTYQAMVLPAALANLGAPPPLNLVRRRRPFFLLPNIAAAAILALLIFFTTLLVQDTSASLPGSSLYAVKRLGEDMEGLIMSATGNESFWHIRQVDRRLDELQALQARGQPAFPDLATEIEFHTQAALATSSSLPAPERLEILTEWLAKLEATTPLFVTDQTIGETLHRMQAAVAAEINVELIAVQVVPPPISAAATVQTPAPIRTGLATEGMEPQPALVQDEENEVTAPVSLGAVTPMPEPDMAREESGAGIGTVPEESDTVNATDSENAARTLPMIVDSPLASPTPSFTPSPTLVIPERQAEGLLVGEATAAVVTVTPTLTPIATSAPMGITAPTHTTMPTTTPWPTSTLWLTNTPWPTSTLGPTSTLWPTNTPFPTSTLGPTNTPWPTGTLGPTNTPWPTGTLGPTNTPLATLWSTGTPTATFTATNTPTATLAATNTPTATPAATNTPTATPASTNTSTATLAATNTPTATPAATNTPTATPAPTNTPTATPAATNTSTATPAPTNTPTATLAPMNTPAPTHTPTTTPASTNTPTITPTPTNTPTATPASTNTSTATPTSMDTPTPTNTPTNTPTPILLNAAPAPGATVDGAWARGTGTDALDDDSVTCFIELDYDEDGVGDGGNWGWTNGPLGPGSYTFELWAGAGQCDTSKGAMVGVVMVDYYDSQVTVTYDLNDFAGYSLKETQVWIGNTPLPIKSTGANPGYITTPAQFDIRHSGFSVGTTFYSFAISWPSDSEIYIAAHAVVEKVPVSPQP